MLLFVFGTLMYVVLLNGSLIPFELDSLLLELTHTPISMLNRLTAAHNAQVFALPSNCDESGSPLTCTYYVCGFPSQSSCPNVTGETYATIGDALTAAATTTPATFESQFLLFGDLSRETYAIPRLLQRASFVGSGNGANTNTIKCPNFESSATTQKLALQSLTLTSPGSACITLNSEQTIVVKMSQVTTFGSLYLSGKANSRFDFRDAKLSGPLGSELYIAGPSAYFSFVSSVIGLNTTAQIGNSSMLYVTDASFLGDFTAHLDLTAAASVTLSRFTRSTTFQFEVSKQSPYVRPMGNTDNQLSFLNNNCSSSVALIGSAISADVHYNTFSGMKGQMYLNMAQNKNGQVVEHTSPSLILSARCASNVTVLGNSFSGGTFYIDFPSSENECGTINPYVAPFTRIAKNSFMSATSIQRNLCPKFSTGEEMCEPLLPAVSTSAIGLAERANLPSQHEKLIVDLSENFWGTSHGPWVCCNSNEESASSGAFTTNFFNLSRWCLDSDCHTISPKVLSTRCITTGCEANFNQFMLPVVVSFTLITVIMLLIALIYTVMRIKLDYKTRLIQDKSQEDLIAQVTPRWLVCVATSSVGFLFNLIIIGGILITSSGAEIVPWQLKLRPTSIVAYLLLLVTAALQILFNLVMIASHMLRRAYPTAVRSSSGFYFGSTVFLLCTTVFASLLWVPSEYWTKSSLLGGATKTLTNPSGTLTYLIYVPILINILAGLLVLAPTNLLHKLMHHIAYAKINRKMERELLKGLTADVLVENRLRFVRFVAPLPTLLGCVVFILSLVGFISPSTFFHSNVATIVPTSLLRVRMGLEATYAGVAFVAAIIAIVITYRRPRVSHATSLAYLALGCSFAALFGIYVWAATLARNELVQRVWAYIFIPLQASLLASLILLMFALFSLRSVLLTQMSNYDTSSLYNNKISASYGAINYPPSENPGYSLLNSADALDRSTDVL